MVMLVRHSHRKPRETDRLTCRHRASPRPYRNTGGRRTDWHKGTPRRTKEDGATEPGRLPSLSLSHDALPRGRRVGDVGLEASRLE